MNGLSASILIVLITVVLAAPQRWALLGMATGALYLTQWAVVNIAGFNMFPMRFLEMAGFIRVMARREFSFSSLDEIDSRFLLFYSYITIVCLLRSNDGQAYQIGLAVDATLCYFTFRGLVGGMDDFRWFSRSFVILLVPYVALLFIEMHTAHNPFVSLGGGFSETWFREGRVRCFGSFRGPSLLGSLGASFLPLYIGLCFSKSDRPHAIAGIILCSGIVWFSNSGGPMGFVAFEVLGWLLWPWRARMRLVRRLIVVSTIALALVMKAPIWYLPTHFSFGGDAWHRSYLIDVSMQHLREWWFCGMPMDKTANWFATGLGTADQADITNQFISFGLNAGLMAIVLFISLLVSAFRILGKKLAEIRLITKRPSEAEYLLWGLGVILVGHIANFLSITYFDQFYVIWFMQLAFIPTLARGYECASVPIVSSRSKRRNYPHIRYPMRSTSQHLCLDKGLVERTLD